MAIHPQLAQLVHKLPAPTELLQGCLVKYYTHCQRSLGCRCHQGHPHGPYWYLSIHHKGKTRKVLIPKSKLPVVRQYLHNWKRYSHQLRLIMNKQLTLIKKEGS